MRRVQVFIIVCLLLFITGCAVKEEFQFGVDLRDKNLGFTVENFTVTCIVSQQQLVDSLSISLISTQQTYTLNTTDITTINEFSFENIQDGTYESSCTVCDGTDCRTSEPGTVLVSLETTGVEDYEFDLPPSFILGTPIDGTYFLSEEPLLVSFSCLANDDVGLTAVSLVSDVSGLFSETFIQKPSKSRHLLVKDLVLEPGEYLWTCRATDTRAQTVVAPVRRFTIGPATPEVLPNSEGFDGDTTDFASLDRLTEVEGVVIEDTEFGKISFVDNISSLVGVDLSKGIIITQDSITVNSSLYPQLSVPAKLSFYNVQFDEDTEEAIVEKDGTTYTVSDLTYENGTITFTVGNFSTYTVVITPQGGYNLENEEEEIDTTPTEVVEEEIVDEEIEEPIVEETNTSIPSINTTTTNITAQEEVDEEIIPPPVNEPIETDEERTKEGLIYRDPLLIAALITAFVIIIFLIIWLIQRNSGGKTILKKY